MGGDKLSGGNGDDIYIIDNANDIITENINQGIDLVYSSVTYTLSANVENLTLTGTASINGTGSNVNNQIVGNSGNNTLNGGSGDDILSGGSGNDIYFVDSLGDVATESANQGTEVVNSSVTYTLANNFENLILIGSNAIDGTGNTLNNTITGNSASNVLIGGNGNDTLDGSLGNDVLDGGLGNDVYFVATTADSITESSNQGTDIANSSATYIISANIENLTLIGNPS